MPAGGNADGEAVLLESLEGQTETGVVDAQELAEGGPGERLAGAEQGAARTLSASGRGGAAAAGAARCSTVSSSRSSGRRTK